MTNPFDLTGRAALVTGASRGLGKEIAVALAESGADLLIGSRKAGEIRRTAEEIARATGRRVVGVPLEVTDRASVEAAVATAMESFGRIDILVNNAGINVRSPIGDIADEDFHAIQATNVAGVMYCCRAVAGHMVAAGYGRIINIGSALSLVGLTRRVSYCTSKGAVMGLTRALAVELARTGVTVNCVCPGPFQTEINRAIMDDPEASAEVLGCIPMDRWGRMHEIRTPVLFLAAEGSGYVTGAAVTVDGGWTAQ